MEKTNKFIKEVASLEPGSAPSVAYMEALIMLAREAKKEIDQTKESTYCVLLNSDNMPKNRLQKEVIDFLQTQSRRLIYDLEDYKYTITKFIEYANAKHKNCTPLDVRFYNQSTNVYEDSWGLSLGSTITVSFRIIKMKG